MLRAAQAAARASVELAAAGAIRAQHELAEAALLGISSGPPLPADLPHVGAYRTGFDEVFALRGVLPRARLLHRILPVRRQTIEARAAAVQAAGDALQAVAEAYAARRADLPAVLAAADHWTSQRQAFVAAVCQYNHDIADYALAVAGPVVPSQSLISMLIVPTSRSGPSSTQPVSPAGQGQPPASGGASSAPAASGVIPATALEPSPDPRLSLPAGSGPASGIERPRAAQQIPAWGVPVDKPEAAPSSGLLPAPSGEPRLAPPLDAQRSAPTPAKAANPGSGAGTGPYSSGAGQGSGAPLDSRRAEGTGAAAVDSVAPPAPMERVVRRLLAEPSDSSAAMAMFAGLADASPAIRAKQLCRVLYTVSAGPSEQVRPAELGELLRSYLAADRRGLIHAYWAAACRAAQYQALVRQSELLESLVPVAVERRKQPSGARELLQVRARQLQVEAEQTEARSRLLGAQFDLTERSGRSLESPWLWPVTPPHAGPYQLQLESQPPERANSWAIRRLAASVSGQYAYVQQQAAAVVAADLARAEATAAYLRGGGHVEVVLAAIESYTRQTQAFLEAVAQYNQAIADYALAVVPPTLTADQLLRTLVVVK